MNEQLLERSDFAEIVQMIASSRANALRSVNTQLIDLYWKVGEYISHKLEKSEWGDGVIAQLANFLARTQPGLRGFTRPNLFRMRQFFNAYKNDEKVSPLVRQLPWTHNLIILSHRRQTKLPDKKLQQQKLFEFYLQNASEEDGEV